MTTEVGVAKRPLPISTLDQHDLAEGPGSRAPPEPPLNHSQ